MKSFLLTILSVMFLAACTEQSPLKQSKTDRLAGVTNAICYSGFRSGQHPDRGDGAVNSVSFANRSFPNLYLITPGHSGLY